MSETFDRSQLDGKDREQLTEIASALGVKSVSRMRKADLVEAIIGAAVGARTVREVDAPQGAIDARRRRRLRRSPRKRIHLPAATPRSTRWISTPVPGAARAPAMAATPTARRTPCRTDRGPSSCRVTTRARPRPLARTTTRRRSTRRATTQVPAAPIPATPTTAPPIARLRDRRSGATTTAPATSAVAAGAGRDRERPGDGRVDGRPERPEREGRIDRGDEYSGELIEIEGLLDLRDEGYGFLRASGYLAGRNDAYVSASQVRRFGLRKGDHVKGATRPPASSEKYPALVRVDLINDVTIDEARHRVRFEDLTPLFPDSRLRLELDDNPGEITGRIIDLIAPIGRDSAA